ncbi:hypothetical protein YPPY46_2139 [Yersinia pestis PY-46]|uniref:Uncharacterized protein n=4 Tax=Yersinia pestis TaxID=632 RepID=Q8CL09_YERPE|nr:hypothetical [Yersinia pestis KIM10+]ABG13180.1 conserved hypothetical protein [Yersinia pestis Antiqua]ABG18614.1 conserved hypothetical protein [Yersinia pestis Nepal516]ABX86958.1 conserved hypothetical protein [Yersinia pestis Angola]EDR31977.1 conserved hypothetical protein [Yersinia pestis biovar Orientalis str. IP275]EDR39274.1 conserved hypothetical protein [Yersinia pestis biovar Orientalis str. F1991016]EDR42519.1 conserved hypothetical protein [Yersinia pestis biovar Antiqua str
MQQQLLYLSKFQQFRLNIMISNVLIDSVRILPDEYANGGLKKNALKRKISKSSL